MSSGSYVNPNLHLPTEYHISGNSLIEWTEIESERELLDDGRGLVHIWEPPITQARYIISGDPTVGITGWSRATRIEGDHKTDNAALEIFRVDAIKRLKYLEDGTPDIDPITKVQRFNYADLQVAEFFAPIDAVEFARVLNLMGRIYAGDSEDQAELIFESYPGPGILTLQELLRLGYSNLWQWEIIGDGQAEATSHIGWRSWRESQRLLWYRARRHLMEDRVEILSPWLLEEYRNAVIDPDKMRARAAYGVHDDLLQAASMAYWAAHRWTYDIERTWEPVTETAAQDPQRTAPTLDGYRSYKEAWADAVDSWG